MGSFVAHGTFRSRSASPALRRLTPSRRHASWTCFLTVASDRLRRAAISLSVRKAVSLRHSSWRALGRGDMRHSGVGLDSYGVCPPRSRPGGRQPRSLRSQTRPHGLPPRGGRRRLDRRKNGAA